MYPMILTGNIDPSKPSLQLQPDDLLLLVLPHRVLLRDLLLIRVCGVVSDNIVMQPFIFKEIIHECRKRLF